MTTTLKTENKIQADAIRQCTCKDVLAFIERNGALFRLVINEYKENKGRLPTDAELLWVASEKLKHDIRKEK